MRPELNFLLLLSVSPPAQKGIAPTYSSSHPRSLNLSKGIYFSIGWAGQSMTEVLWVCSCNWWSTKSSGMAHQCLTRGWVSSLPKGISEESFREKVKPKASKQEHYAINSWGLEAKGAEAFHNNSIVGSVKLTTSSHQVPPKRNAVRPSFSHTLKNGAQTFPSGCFQLNRNTDVN